MRTESSARFYELMAISVPDGTPEELAETAESVSGYVTSAGGTMLRSSNDSPWGRRRLAYPIRHNSADLRDGFYTLYHFQIEPQRIEDIERELRLNERVIRHLLLQLDREPVFAEPEEEGTGEETGEAAEATAGEATATAQEPASQDEAAGEPREAAPVEVVSEPEVVSDEPDSAESKEE